MPTKECDDDIHLLHGQRDRINGSFDHSYHVLIFVVFDNALGQLCDTGRVDGIDMFGARFGREHRQYAKATVHIQHDLQHTI